MSAVDKLTPSAQRTLDALNAGPGNVHELAERTGRSRSTTDKAIGDLAKAGLIVKVDDSGDPADGAPARWQLAGRARTDEQRIQPETDGEGGSTEAGAADTPPPADAATQAEPADPGADPGADPAAGPPPVTDPRLPDHENADDGDANTTPVADAQVTDVRVTDVQAGGHGTGSDANTGDGPDLDGGSGLGPAGGGEASDAQADGQNTADGNPAPPSETRPQGEATSTNGDGAKKQVEAPKLCRGCQTQMPKICDCCWQKTPAYCGTCRRDMPQVRRGEPGEPVILSNGLPKLRPGELEKLVEQVMRQQPLPAFAGVVGWTGGRIAVHLPGRSTGAINNALEKLDRTGVAELIGDRPMRYQLKPAPTADTAPANTGDAGPASADSTEPLTGAQQGQTGPDTGDAGPAGADDSTEPLTGAQQGQTGPGPATA